MLFNSPSRKNHPFLIDAYCGSGLFGISAASYFKKVIGIEISREGFLGAQANAELNRISNTEFILGDASSIFDAIDSTFRPCTLLVDPPRKGCDQNFLSQALAFSPNYIVYISCDPAYSGSGCKNFSGWRVFYFRYSAFRSLSPNSSH
jgi:23S rRNA (uracil1939-C5)-methyltransferase/tRNA (uracil-5-)-methyltransferase